jgi:hypothetical protein
MSAALRPGGYLYLEAYCLTKPKEEMNAEKQEAFGVYSHIPYAPVVANLRREIEEANLEIVEFEDCGERWSENCWEKSNVWLSELADNIDNMHEIYRYILNLHAKTQPKILSRMQKFTSAELREKFPRTCEACDPDVWVHGITQDTTAYRVIARKAS